MLLLTNSTVSHTVLTFITHLPIFRTAHIIQFVDAHTFIARVYAIYNKLLPKQFPLGPVGGQIIY